MRKEKTITIESGRDAGKTFKISEMPVARLEKWSCRALLAIFGSEIPEDVAAVAQTSAGAAVASTVMKGLRTASWEKVEPLYDELLLYIARVPRPDKAETVRLTPDNLDFHIEDLSTIFRLRLEVLNLSFDFFDAGSLFNSLTSGVTGPQDS